MFSAVSSGSSFYHVLQVSLLAPLPLLFLLRAGTRAGVYTTPTYPPDPHTHMWRGICLRNNHLCLLGFSFLLSLELSPVHGLMCTFLMTTLSPPFWLGMKFAFDACNTFAPALKVCCNNELGKLSLAHSNHTIFSAHVSGLDLSSVANPRFSRIIKKYFLSFSCGYFFFPYL